MSYALRTSATSHDLGKETYGSSGQPPPTGSNFPYYLWRCAGVADCNYFVATAMTVQGIPPLFVVCNTGIHDIESQNPIPYYLAPFVIISRCSKETVQRCKVSLQLIYQQCLLSFCTSLLKLESSGDTFSSLCAFQLCSTKLLVHRHI